MERNDFRVYVVATRPYAEKVIDASHGNGGTIFLDEDEAHAVCDAANDGLEMISYHVYRAIIQIEPRPV